MCSQNYIQTASTTDIDDLMNEIVRLKEIIMLYGSNRILYDGLKDDKTKFKRTHSRKKGRNFEHY